MNTENISIGSRVRACVTAQGLIQGCVYRVLDMQRHRTFLGTYTYLRIIAVDRTIAHSTPETALTIGNPHLVLEEVAS